MNQSERRIFLIQELLKERKEYRDIEIPKSSIEQKQLLRALMNIRMPQPMDSEFLKIQDTYLQQETLEKGIVDIHTLPEIQEGIILYQGDITTLKCDAIVNAANSQMLGCFYPNHTCIDNCIHTYAGIQLRLECDKIMQKQGHEEETGLAKITSAYNLPCEYVIHTVGPIIQSSVTNKDIQSLKSCYTSCLELAAKYNLESIAFCCISTGEFHFPNELAAKIAIETVQEYMKQETSIKKVIFNVFKNMDKEIYERYLETC